MRKAPHPGYRIVIISRNKVIRAIILPKRVDIRETCLNLRGHEKRFHQHPKNIEATNLLDTLADVRRLKGLMPNYIYSYVNNIYVYK